MLEAFHSRASFHSVSAGGESSERTRGRVLVAFSSYSRRAHRPVSRKHSFNDSIVKIASA